MKIFILILMLMTQMTAWSQTSTPTSTIDTVKEVFLKGSIDGDSMFMVLGTADGYKISKEMMKDAINMNDLSDLGEDVKKIGKAAKGFKEVISEPWKSLKEIPKAYKVDFEKAREAYYSADNQIAGVLKYSGWAIWAQVDGAYYLVIEAPVVMAYQTVAHSLSVAWKVTGLGIKVTWNVIKPAVGLIASAAVMTYATVSSSIATTATLIAAGGVATFKGGKWLLVTLPRKLLKPASAQIVTSYNYEDQMKLAEKMKIILTQAEDIFGQATEMESELNTYKSEFSIKLKNGNLNAYELRTMIKNKKVEIKIEATRAYFKQLRSEYTELSRKEAKEKLVEEMTTILDKIITKL
jgi:hypothetical protein